MSVPEVDVAVVGAGGCGMAAALCAAQRGAEVVLLEKDSALGSDTALSSANVFAADTRFQRAAGVRDSPELMAEDILRTNGHRSDPELTLALCQVSHEVVHWLVDDVGYPLELAEEVRRSGHSVARAHSHPDRGGGQGLVLALRRAVAASPHIVLADKTPGRGLVCEDGPVVGVQYGLGEQQVLRARKVIFACNGFGSNREMLAEHCPEALPFTYVGSEGSTGEAIRWGVGCGAALDHMAAFLGSAHVVVDHRTRLSPGIPMEGGIVVNCQARRFAREDVGYSRLALDLAALPERQAIEIFDGRILGIVENSEVMRESRRAGAFRRFETLDELAAAFRLDPAVLRETVEGFRRAAAAGSDEFGRTHFGLPLAAPYYAGRITPGILQTQGGLRVDARARVLRPDGRPIDNLYAGGGTARGISGDGPAGYSSGNGLLAALGLGMIAGRDAAAALGLERSGV